MSPIDPPSALPSVTARWMAFLSVFIGGALGAVIGGSFADLQCNGACDTWIGATLWVGSILGAAGAALVAALTLRALGEWKTVRALEAAAVERARNSNRPTPA